jgi:uncharacterized membrane protein HdeD (DUF308 family)/pimeloyl-ACP methyl ester carboxylesterase
MPERVRDLIGRRLPWWQVALPGVFCVVLGALLTADPFRSLSTLAWLVGAALVLSGMAELASASTSSSPWLSRAVGLVWVVAGVVAVSARGLTIHALAIAVGIALVVGGAGKIASATSGRDDERWVTGLSGLTNVIVGVLAAAWPEVTVLALAVLFGVRTVLFGFGLVALALRLRRSPASGLASGPSWPRRLRLGGTVAALGLALGAWGVSVAIDRAHPAAPGRFYSAPSPLPAGPPGTIIRSEIIPGFHAGATAYRVLYLSTGYDGKPAAVSGEIVVPDGSAPPGGRKVIAYTHGTTGVATSCAPSLVSGAKQPLLYEGGAALLAAGYIVAASDYQGLGTRGPHPYLIGASEAMNELDAVRAARHLAAAQASPEFAVWGHSQGGHAALFTGQLAASYAPELHLVGVAAGAPVPNLVDLFKVNIKTLVGKVLIAMALQSWERVYDDADLDQIVKAEARPLVAKIARHCLYNQKQILASVPSALVLGLTFLHTPPWEAEPWKTIAERNSPGATRIHAPLLIVQGGSDKIVDPAVTRRFVERLCGLGEKVELLVLPAVGHLETGHDAAPAVARWIGDRFAGKLAPTTCR